MKKLTLALALLITTQSWAIYDFSTEAERKQDEIERQAMEEKIDCATFEWRHVVWKCMTKEEQEEMTWNIANS